MADLLTLGANASLLYKSALSTVSNNIANLTTEGYSRQTIDVEENTPDAIGSTFIGTGARLNSVTRSYDAFAENSLRQSNSELVGQYELIDCRRSWFRYCGVEFGLGSILYFGGFTCQ